MSDSWVTVETVIGPLRTTAAPADWPAVACAPPEDLDRRLGSFLAGLVRARFADAAAGSFLSAPGGRFGGNRSPGREARP